MPKSPLNNTVQNLVSMVVPCYNKELYIDRFFESAYAQKWHNIELILVDDGSTDGTAQRIMEWIPRFKAHGFLVRFIQQPNQGVACAVKNGMLQMTGEFFCQVDADDEIHPEYVSTMAGFLTENNDFDVTFCRIEKVTTAPDGTLQRSPAIAKPPVGPDALQNVLCTRMLISVISIMVRANYLTQCRVIDNFCVEPSLCQEPQILFPLLCGGGKMKTIDKILYSAHMVPNSLSRAATISKAEQYSVGFSTIIRNTISTLVLPDDQKHMMASLVDWFEIQYRYRKLHIDLESENAYTAKFLDTAATFVNKHIYPCPHITTTDICSATWSVFRCAVNACIFHERILFAPRNRIIGYGALGKVANRLLPLLANTEMQPDLLWDKNAALGDTICGKPVDKPHFETLQENDMVLLFPCAIDKEEFFQFANTTAPTVLTYNDICLYWSVASDLKIVNRVYVP